jgi:hypothetical protein
MESLKTRRKSSGSRLFYQKIIWLGREDSNLRMGESKSAIQKELSKAAMFAKA